MDYRHGAARFGIFVLYIVKVKRETSWVAHDLAQLARHMAHRVFVWQAFCVLETIVTMYEACTINIGHCCFILLLNVFMSSININ